MGNVSTFALEFGDEERVQKLTKFCVQSGSDISSPACGLGTKSPLANIQAILKTLKMDEEAFEKMEAMEEWKEEEMKNAECQSTAFRSCVLNMKWEKLLLEVLLEEGIFVDNPCNGKGLCGRCKVRILEGELSEPEATEQKLLKQEELESGVRLSCLVKPETDLEIELMQKERKHKVLTGGYIPSFEFDQDIRKIVVEIKKPTLEDQTPMEDQILRQIPEGSLDLGCLQMSAFVPGQKTSCIT